MELDVIVPGVKAEVVGSDCITVLFNRPWKTLSSAIFNGGIIDARAVLNMHIPKSYNHEDPEGHIRRMIEKIGLPEPVVGMMTAAEMENVAVINKEDEQGEFRVTTIITAGVSNPATAGERPRFPFLEGTINVILLLDGNFSSATMASSVMIATEAKTLALRELDVRSFSMGSTYDLSTNLASGTTTDTVVVSCTGKGKLIWYHSTGLSFRGRFGAFEEGIEVGRLIALAVKEGVLKALEKQDKIRIGRSLLKRLEERGVSIGHFMRIAVDHYFSSFSSRESRDNLPGEEVFRKELEEVLSRDRGVCSLVMAGLGLEKDEERRGFMPYEGEIVLRKGSNEEIHRLPSRVLGGVIADYIGGVKGSTLYGQSVKFFENTGENPLKGEMTPTMYYVLSGIVGGVMGHIDQKRKQGE
ncbi:MAG: adenosylcobinamide amidohydrolase [Candidatus Wukongarchaeota archaeon]|nr:adenosylcobinamide amidohydrolase [Candidatus Wukongarchaeota archaeon]